MINHLKILGALIAAACALTITGVFLACTTILHECAIYGSTSLPSGVKIQCSVSK